MIKLLAAILLIGIICTPKLWREYKHKKILKAYKENDEYNQDLERGLQENED